MTKTDKPYLFEHDQKVTATNVNLLNSTENHRILPKTVKNNYTSKYYLEYLKAC